jgi:hypothetical protein
MEDPKHTPKPDDGMKEQAAQEVERERLTVPRGDHRVAPQNEMQPKPQPAHHVDPNDPHEGVKKPHDD